MEDVLAWGDVVVLEDAVGLVEADGDADGQEAGYQDPDLPFPGDGEQVGECILAGAVSSWQS